MLKVELLTVAFGTRVILKDVSFEVAPGTVLGVIGPNGAGKTTLIRALCGILPLQSGTIEANGQNIQRLSLTAPSPRRRRCRTHRRRRGSVRIAG